MKSILGCVSDREEDLSYFRGWQLTILEVMTRYSPAEAINHTTMHYSPMFYALTRQLQVRDCLEIGVARGWTSGFLAWAVKDNNIRFNQKGMYYGLDIRDRSMIQERFDLFDLPAKMIHTPEGSVEWLKKQDLFAPKSLDLIFDDGWHNTDYVRQEVEMLYPLLRDGGYLFMHDAYAYCEVIVNEVMKNPNYKWEAVRFVPNFGMAVLRKIGNRPELLEYTEPNESILKEMCKLIPCKAEETHWAPFVYLLARVIGAMGHLESMTFGDNLTTRFMSKAIQEQHLRYPKDHHLHWVVDGKGMEGVVPIKKITDCPQILDLVYFSGEPHGAAHQIAQIYNKLKGEGHGYLLLGDINNHWGFFESVRDDPNYEWEHVVFPNDGGLAILRKMKGYDYNKIFFPDGCQVGELGSIY